MTKLHFLPHLSLVALLSLAAGCKDSGHSLGSAKNPDASGVGAAAPTGGASGSASQTSTATSTDTGGAIGKTSALGGSSGGSNTSASGGSGGINTSANGGSSGGASTTGIGTSAGGAGQSGSTRTGGTLGGTSGTIGSGGGTGGQTASSTPRDAGSDLGGASGKMCASRDEPCASLPCCGGPLVCLFVFGTPICCESTPPPPDGGTAALDSRVVSPDSATEYVDSTGRCLGALDPSVHGCPSTYGQALIRKDSCGTACAGPANGLLIYTDYCTPSHGCAYAADTTLLVGYQLTHDTPDFCGGKSAYAYYGQFPKTITYTSLDLDEKCPAP